MGNHLNLIRIMPAEVCAFAPLGDKTTKFFPLRQSAADFLFVPELSAEYGHACLSDKNFKGVVLTMNASLAIQILPKVQGDEEVCRVVDEVIAYIQSTGLALLCRPL